MTIQVHSSRLNWLLLLAFALFLAALAVPAQAQSTGIIAGTIVDETFGGGLPQANVRVEELSTEGVTVGAATDLDGAYRIPGVPEGTYTVVFTYIGYTTQRVTDVEVVAGEVTTLDIALSDEPLELGDEVVVTAAAILDNDAALLRQRQRAAAVSDAIGAETISRSGSSDAADAMERVTGAAVEGGRYVTVRGLGDRYANTQLNGAQLPTADPDRRSVQFDLFPANLLENIVTLKTFTADQPGNFSGGLVDITTKSFPERFDVRASVSTGFDTQAQFADDFLRFQGAGVGLFGTGGPGGLPAIVQDPDLTIPTEIQARFDPAAATQLDAISQAFNTPSGLVRGSAPVNQGYGLSLGDQFAAGPGDLGVILGLNYSRGSSYYDGGTVARFDAGTGPEGGAELSEALRFSDSRGTSEVTWGGIANLTYRLGGRHEIGLNTLYTRSAESEARFQVGASPEISEDLTIADRALFYTERDLVSLQLRGRHQLPSLLGATVEWQGTFSETAVDEPNGLFFANTRQGEPGSYTYGTVVAGGVVGQTRVFRGTDEGLRGGALDVTVPLSLFGNAGQLKLGGRYDATDRDASERQFQIQTNRNARVQLQPGDDGFGDVNAYLGQLGIIGTDDRGRPVFGNYVDELDSPFILGNNYEAYLDVPAAYLMAEFAPLERLRVIAGARFEQTRQGVTTQALDPEEPGTVEAPNFQTGRIAEDDLLPSLNLVYALTDDMNLRAAGTQTLARPTFLEFTPGCRRSFTLGELVCGNPDLQRSLITNADLRWEWFTGPGEILAVSGYYKDIANPIELTFINVNGVLQYRNVEQAEILGLELEARQRLSRLVPALASVPVVRGLSLGGNVSVVSSSVSIDAEELADRRALDPDAPDTRALQGQSPFIVNADLTYENLEAGTNVGVYFNVFGQRLSQVGLLSVPDVYERSSPQLDVTASQRLFEEWTLKLTAKNLLGAGYEAVYDADFEGTAAPYQLYDRPTSFSLGLSFNPRFGVGGVVPNVPDPSAN